MRQDNLYLNDIVEAVDAILHFIADAPEEQFLWDDLVQAAVLQKTIVIGEAAARISPELKVKYPNVPWSDIIGFRNIAVHAYFSVDWSIVWVTTQQDAPQLREQIVEILAVEFPQGSDPTSETTS